MKRQTEQECVHDARSFGGVEKAWSSVGSKCWSDLSVGWWSSLRVQMLTEAELGPPEDGAVGG